MLNEAPRRSGIDAVGELAWGTHFCQFYRNREDLADVLVPYFRAGLADGEACLWVTSEPLPARDARDMLRNAVPNLDEYIAGGQIEIVDHDDWYLHQGAQDAAAVLKGWREREERALTLGFAGLRLTGNTYWLERKDWDNFVQYEQEVNRCFQTRRIVGLCSYCTDRCNADEVIDVVRNHQFAVARRHGDWELIESAPLKLAKAEIQKINTQLEQRVMERTLQLEAALRSRDEFLSIASHELRTPLAAVKLHLQGLQLAAERGALEPDGINQRLKRADRQLVRLADLVDELLIVSSMEVSRVGTEPEVMDLAPLVHELAMRYADQAQHAEIDLRVSTPPSLVGHWDRARLEKVLSNLLSNAIKYGPNQPVEVAVVADGGQVRITVRDHGIGIAPDDQERVFRRFERAVSGRNYGGFGLGLWIADLFTRAMGGKIQVQSVLGEGSLFTVELPIGEGPQA